MLTAPDFDPVFDTEGFNAPQPQASAARAGGFQHLNERQPQGGHASLRPVPLADDDLDSMWDEPLTSW
jgi:hypothetical protein